MQWIKDIVQKYEKKENIYFYQGEEIFKIINDKLFAFLPLEFEKYKEIQYIDNIETLPFNWSDNIPQFRFTSLLKSKPTKNFIKEYESYLLHLQYNKKQKRFHIYPNSLLKKWKKDDPYIWDIENKKRINYREDFFTLPSKTRQPLLIFLECFYKPIENELIALINKKKTKKVKFNNFIEFIFQFWKPASHNIYTKSLEEKSSKKIVIENYKDIDQYRISLLIKNEILSKGFFPSGITTPLSYLQIYELHINMPLINSHFQRTIEKGCYLAITVVAPRKILILYESLSCLQKFNNEELWKLIEKYWNIAIKDSKWALYNNNTNKEFMRQLQNVNSNERKPIVIITK